MSSKIVTTRGWERQGTGPDDGSSAITWNESLALPEIGPTSVLVKIHARSMNYPEISIANGTFPWSAPDGPVVPGSDGAGEIIAIGSHVDLFRVNDKVFLQHYPGFLTGSAPPLDQVIPGTHMDGTFRELAVFDQSALLPMPESLTYEEAATLPCSALTAWNCLFGLNRLKAGDFVLTQGTGGVSLFAIQFALVTGATVIATTSSAEKAQKLKRLGAHHVLNYKEDLDWGETAKEIAAQRGGCQYVIDIGGPSTIAQSFKCVAPGGEIDIVGFVTGTTYSGGPTFLDPLLQVCTVRGIEVGNRLQFEEMSVFIEAWGIKPVLDDRKFTLLEMKEAYRYNWAGKHFGKIAIINS